jgi:hypothetical protein
MVAAMNFTRCQERRTHLTRDTIVSVSDAAAKQLMQGSFPKGYRVSCDCMESGGKMKPEDCENLNVYDSEGKPSAKFSVADFQAAQADDGRIIILRRASTQDSSARPPFPVYVADRPVGNLTLHRLQKIHEDFYRRGDQ